MAATARPLSNGFIFPKTVAKSAASIGIPTIEDKILQRAVVMLMEPIYEGEFHDFSFGFRPHRSPHQAL